MLVDFNDTVFTDLSLPRTVIIGSGPVGLAVATGLRRRGIAATVIEGGPAAATADSDLNDGDIAGLPFAGTLTRGRGLGGGTSQWAGQCLRFHAADFQRREWVEDSGWPIDYDDLVQFYAEAEQYFDVTADGYFGRVWRDFGLEPGTLIDTDVLTRFSCFAQQPRVFDRDRRMWARDPDCWFIFNAVVTEFGRSGSGIDRLTIRARNGNSLAIPCDTVIICTGGIDIPRTLLEPMPDFPAGIGEGNIHVGRHFQDHPNLAIGTVIEYERGQGVEQATRYLSTFHRRGRRYLPRLVLSAARQRELRVLNAGAFAVFEFPEESLTQNLRELQAAVGGRRFDLSTSSRAVRAIKEPGALARTVKARIQGAAFGERPSAINIDGFVEQDPSTSSKVSLSSRLDPFGRPLATVDWQVGERERESLYSLATGIDGFLRSNRIGGLAPNPLLKEPGDAWLTDLRDHNHHMGTARMAASPHAGVVDVNCKFFHLANLYLCGGAVMPTGSHANPTLTMTALGFRLAAHLAKAMKVAGGTR